MSRARLVAAAVAGATASLLVALGASAAPLPTTTYLTAHLNGANERPGPGDPDAVGVATIRVVDGVTDKVCLSLSTRGIDGTLSGLHIHLAAPTAAGPVVVGFVTPTRAVNVQCVTLASTQANQALIDNLEANPGQYYINVHSSTYPAGAIRGQLVGTGF